MKTKLPSSAGTKKSKPVGKQTQVPRKDEGYALIERRLHTARTTKRLDLSTSSSSTVVYQLFPRQVLIQEQIGHHLRELWLTNHHIPVIPPEIVHFEQLQVLGFGGNCLSTLPDEIRQLTKLESLYLERNQIKSFPTTFQFPRHLRNLRLDHNALTVFPEQLFNLRLLNVLGLSHNHMTSLPPQIRRLANLMILDVDHNAITKLPDEEMVCLQRLEQLGLEGNCLDTLPSCLERMPHLFCIRISGNLSQHTEKDDTGCSRVPRRYDGYYQTVEGYQLHKNTLDAHKKPSSNVKPTAMPGTLPCREQNIINAEYRRPLSMT